MTEAEASAAAAAIVDLVRDAGRGDDAALVRTVAARLLAAYAAGHAEGRPFWLRFKNQGLGQGHYAGPRRIAGRK